MEGKDTRGYPYLGYLPAAICYLWRQQDRPQHQEIHVLISHWPNEKKNAVVVFTLIQALILFIISAA